VALTQIEVKLLGESLRANVDWLAAGAQPTEHTWTYLRWIAARLTDDASPSPHRCHDLVDVTTYADIPDRVMQCPTCGAVTKETP